MNKLHILLSVSFFSSLILLTACKTSKSSGDYSKCTTNGTVQDFSGLDGCSLLIVLENGDKYLPTNPEVDGKVLKAGQNIQFGYKEGEDMVSICMSESKIVELTCLNILEEAPIPEKIPCLDITKPMEVTWMAKMIKSHQPEQILKYAYRTDGWAYLFKGKETLMYDCQGTLVCEKSESDCLKLVMPGAKGQIIWQDLGNNE